VGISVGISVGTSVGISVGTRVGVGKSCSKGSCVTGSVGTVSWINDFAVTVEVEENPGLDNRLTIRKTINGMVVLFCLIFIKLQ